ncbi:nucleolar complex protein 3 homolog [Parasteatoda tepidariorum]|uniref:nucleolar complex protein 3 homolog n=1 Tax=Parasteatoda tepidariorum TaxID=114398 RepID=UPI001C71BAB8|nr:nucleolar complex protein 3 homolog [Parasteatoda tepidariorum]
MSVKKKQLRKETKFKKRDKSKSNVKQKNKANFKKKSFSKQKKSNFKSNHEQKNRQSEEETEVVSSECSDIEENYEKQPRIRKSTKVRNLLPIKNKQGLMFRSEILPDSEDESPEIKTVKNIKSENLIETYAHQKKQLQELKRKVALICTSLIEDPDNNMLALKELISMLQNPTTKMIVSEKKILCLSLLHVFSDILPGYKIRLQEETDSKVKLKKETKKLLGYEQTLLKCYKKYLDLLYELIRDMRSTQMSSASLTFKKVAIEIGLVALKCKCELLKTRFSFNFFRDIINKLVPLAIDGEEEVTELCCDAFQKMFKADKLGEASEELVKQIVSVIKQRKFRIPPALLRSFLSLNLREAKPEIEKIDMNKGRKEWQRMSRTQRRDKKKMKELEAELKETQAYESVETVRKHHTKTLNKIFWVFFHILKDGDKMILIAPALEGLSKFAHLINLEFFDDLNAVLCGMMESGKLNDVEKLHGVYTLFTILAGQAESLHIDPHKIYCHMYQGLWNLSHSTDIEHLDLTLKCLEFNILRKKKRISSNRMLAFIKRVCTVSLQTPVHGTLGLLSSLRNLILNVKGSDILLDSESSIGSGIYLPEIEDPEHCNPHSTALWELHILRKHYNPAVKLYAQHILSGCENKGRLSLPDKLINSTPEEVLHLFAEVAVMNKIDYMEENEEPPKKKIKHLDIFTNESFENEVDLELHPVDLQNVVFNL